MAGLISRNKYNLIKLIKLCKGRQSAAWIKRNKYEVVCFLIKLSWYMLRSSLSVRGWNIKTHNKGLISSYRDVNTLEKLMNYLLSTWNLLNSWVKFFSYKTCFFQAETIIFWKKRVRYVYRKVCLRKNKKIFLITTPVSAWQVSLLLVCRKDTLFRVI